MKIEIKIGYAGNQTIAQIFKDNNSMGFVWTTFEKTQTQAGFNEFMDQVNEKVKGIYCK